MFLLQGFTRKIHCVDYFLPKGQEVLKSEKKLSQNLNSFYKELNSSISGT